MKKLLVILLAAAVSATLFVGLTGCAPEKKPVVIGISQIVEHPALDAVRKGFIDYLNENGYKEGENVKYDVNIAQGDMSTAKLIADKLVGMNPNLILTIATPTSQVMVEATTEIPIVFSAVTDPVGAGLVASLEGGGKNVTGTTDLSPVDRQFELIKEVIPEIKNLGFIYNAGEANSLTSLKQAKEEAAKLGFEVVEATASNSGEVLSAAESLVGKVDAIHIPTDNTVVSAFESVTKVCKDNDIPLFAADVDSVPRGAVAAIAIDYYRLGKQTGRMAIEILEGKDPGTMPTESLEDLLLYVNPGAAAEMGIELPKALVDRADKIVE
ncbi:MAG: ABC transporter substrate-binding protein [Deltaproteobacteria bacterium]|uniref:ABC transporter substrate-binding protein n=1 Tax=Candidatus Zymogenus saltonus TaxID=2844893 RepID=A0A9D8KGI1_9DELT|nr:ABC transporter substrate-binding protein [Candidatus Zymogenus saltonus]